MPKKIRQSLLALLLCVSIIVPCLAFQSCALSLLMGEPILQDKAEQIEENLTAALKEKATSCETLANEYEASGEILKDPNGNDMDMSQYISKLRRDALILRSFSFDAYNLAMLDDLFSRFYIGDYAPFASVCPQVVDVLASNFYLEKITDRETANQVLYTCYALALGDIYAGYVDEESAKEEQAGDDSYVGIGVTVTQLQSGYLEVISVLSDSPAAEAGITTGDILLAVNGEDVLSLGYDQTLLLVRGTAGTPVSLTFQRGDSTYTVSVIRRKVINLTVDYKMLESGTGKTGYIHISQFEATTFTQFVAAVEALEAAGATEFVFDVRSNPGGNLETILGILEYILPDDTDRPLIRMQYTDSTVSYYTVKEYLQAAGADSTLLARYESAQDHEITARMTVLCNRYTASAGELFTSALKDFGVAEIFGETTYGKGVGQTGYYITDLYAYMDADEPYYSALLPGYFRLSSFYYSPPVSDNYNGIGVLPHHTVTLSEEALAYHVSNIPESLDDQLQAAIAFVQGDTPLSPAPTPAPSPSPQEPSSPQEPQGSQESSNPASSPSVALWVTLGIIVACAVAVTVCFIVERSRRKKAKKEFHFSSFESTQSDDHRKNDN